MTSSMTCHVHKKVMHQKAVRCCFVSEKKQNDLSPASPNVPHYNLAEVRATQLI